MSKRRITWDENKLERYIKEGRGQGIGKDYKSWITIQDFPSLGRCSRINGWKTNRVHQFMSDNETRFFYLLEWSDKVIDIREQFPLIHVDDTVAIAEELGVSHPKDRENGTPYVLTTDFMITVRENGKERNIARTVKPALDLEKKRIIEKFEIERRYWEKHGVEWGIVTEQDIPKELASNIEWIHSAYHLEATSDYSRNDLAQIQEMMLQRINESEMLVRNFTEAFDKEYKLDSGTSLYLLKNLIASKAVYVDMSSRIDLNKPINSMIIANKLSEEKIV